MCGCLIGVLGFGPRSGLAFFLTPMSSTFGWGRDVFALALAIQMLLWGAAQPFAGAMADRYGAVPVLSVGAILYSLGLAAMAYADTPPMLHLTAGLIVGFGLAGASFTIVIGAFGKLMPPEWRSIAFGAGTAAGSFGQFLFSPLAVDLIDRFGWQATLLIFAAAVLLILPLSFALAAPRQAGAVLAQTGAPRQSVVQALTEAFGHTSYVLLVLGFFTCGFQIFFIAVHLPAYLVDRGLPAEIGGWAIATIGLFNIVGAISAGWISNVMPKRYLLSLIYFGRAVAILVYILLPPSAVTTLVFSRGAGAALAVDCAAHLRPGRPHVRHALARHAVRLRLLQPSGRRVPRGLARRPPVRTYRLLRRGLVALDPARALVSGNQSADCGETRCPSVGRAGLKADDEGPEGARCSKTTDPGAGASVLGLPSTGVWSPGARRRSY